ncbi:MAG: hypothetical protein NVSMB14_17320 [Isosphaeraceae bacterium]
MTWLSSILGGASVTTTLAALAVSSLNIMCMTWIAAKAIGKR